MSLKSQLNNYLKSQYPNWKRKGELEDEAREWGYLSDNCSRKARELENEGKIEKSFMKTKDNRNCVIYRAVINKVEPVMEVRVNQPQML